MRRLNKPTQSVRVDVFYSGQMARADVKIVLNAKPKNLPKPGHSERIFTRAFVNESHSLSVVCFDTNTFVCPSGAPAAGGDKDRK